MARAALGVVILGTLLVSALAGRLPHLQSTLQNLKHAKSGGAAPLPVVLWHGMGDACCHEYSMGKIKQVIEEELGELRGLFEAL